MYILIIISDDAIVFGKLKTTTEIKGKQPGPYDLQIASQGIAISDFARIPRAIIENWVM